MSANWDDIRAALAAAPEVAQSPSATASVIQASAPSTPDGSWAPTSSQGLGSNAAPGTDATGTAQGLAGAITFQASDQVVQKHKSGGIMGALSSAINHVQTDVWDNVPFHGGLDNAVDSIGNAADDAFHTAWNALPGHGALDSAANTAGSAIASGAGAAVSNSGSALGTVAGWANWPLAHVQHGYRYVHDVFVNHGAKHGVGVILSIGNWLPDTVSHLLSQNDPNAPASKPSMGPLNIFNQPIYEDSWKRSETATVSPGRDLAALFQLKPGSVPYNIVSGTGDAAFDIGTDPVFKAGSISKALTASHRVIATTQDLERVATAAKAARVNPAYAPVRRALDDIAADPSAASIATKYPKLGMIAGVTQAEDGKFIAGPSLATQLSHAKDYDGVVDVFRNHLAANQTIGTTATPVLSLTRVPFRNLNATIRSWELPADGGAIPASFLAGDLHATTPSSIALVKNKIARTVNSFVNDTPFAVEGGKIVAEGGKIDPDNPGAVRAIYQLAKYSQSDSAAQMIAQQFAEAPTVAAKHAIWNKNIVSLFHAAGVPDDPEFRKRLMADLDSHQTIVGNNGDSEFGVDEFGKSQSLVEASDGTKMSAALTTHQTGGLYIPRYMHDVVRPIRDARAHIALYGRIDDAIYDHITQPFFKRLVLATGGFAFRNSISENLTRVIGRDGIGVLTAGIAAAAKRIGYGRISDDERQTLLANMANSADENDWRALAADPSKAEVAAELLLRHDGHITPPAVAADHYSATTIGGDDAATLADNTARLFVPGRSGARHDPDRWTLYDHNSGPARLSNAVASHAQMLAQDGGMRRQATAYRDALAGGASKEDASTIATKEGHDWLQNTSIGKALQQSIKRSMFPTKQGEDPLWSWARARTATIRGVTTNKNGEPILPLLDGIADTAKGQDWNVIPSGGMKAVVGPTHRNLLPSNVRALGLDNLPLYVPGQQIVPTAITGTTARIINGGFRRVLSPIIQYTARNGIYVHHVQEELAAAMRLPGITHDEAWHLAETRAVERMIPEIHNPADRSQFAGLSRNFMPFFFARQQAYRRLANAVKEDPVGWRKVQLAYHGLKDIGFVSQDPNTGEDTFSYPISGEVGMAVPWVLNKWGKNVATGIPSGFTGNITGLAAGGDVPGNGNMQVGWAPLVTFSLKGLATVFPEFKGAANTVAGQRNVDQPWWSYLAPNVGVRDAIEAYAGDHSRAFTGAMIDAIQYQMAHGNMPPATAQVGDPAWQKWIDGIRGQTRTMFTIRALMGIGAPSSPILKEGAGAPKGFNVTSPNPVTFTDEFQSYINKDGLSKGTLEFLAKFPNATPYTIFKTEGAGSVNVPETTQALDWAQTNRKFIDANGEVGSLFIPQSDTPDPNALAVYKQQLASGLRHQKSPDAFAQQVMVEQGWNDYEYIKSERDAALAAVPQDPTKQDQIHTQFAQWVKQYGMTAPVWYADYNSQSIRSGQKQSMATELVDIYAKDKQPDSPMTPLIKPLVTAYQDYEAAKAGASTTGASQSTLSDQWDAWLAQVVQENPKLTTIVNRVFKGL